MNDTSLVPTTMPAYMLLLASFQPLPHFCSLVAFSTIQMIREVYICIYDNTNELSMQASSAVLVHDGNIYVTYM